MKITFLLLLLQTIFFSAFSQLAESDLQLLKEREKNLQQLSYRIVNDSLQADRLKANIEFIPKLVEALKIPNSFLYPFDSLSQISVISPPDAAFRIFTWQLWLDNGLFRYYGAIQMNEPQLKLFPLFDYSDSLFYPIQQQLTPQQWYGALYYNIYEFKEKKKNKYYLLFGWDGNDLWSNKKILDVLHFKDGKPVFGAPVFFFEDSLGNQTTQHRIILEYRNDAVVTLNYSEEDAMIIFDHLTAPQQHMQDLKFAQIPDGTYEGFKFKKGKWIHVKKIQTININKFDDPPVPVPKE